MFLRIFKHLLPNSKAWNITPFKNLRNFFKGFTGLGEDSKSFSDSVYQDLFPETTRELEKWERQFGLPNTLSAKASDEQLRRDRLDAAWKEMGGQSPRYFQDTLQRNGFNVFVHEWWEPGTEPPVGVLQCVTPRNPLLVIRQESTEGILGVQCGDEEARAGEQFARCGNSRNPIGYPLVNKIVETEKKIITGAGEPLMRAGEPTALAGNFFTYNEVTVDYIVPNDRLTWPYFIYIGAENFPDIAEIRLERKEEFEDLCLKICPVQQWMGILVKYI